MAEWIYFIHPPRDDFAETMTEEEDAVGQRDVEQAGTIVKSPVADVGDAAGDGDIGQIIAALKGIVPNAGDGVGDDEAGHDGEDAQS